MGIILPIAGAAIFIIIIIVIKVWAVIFSFPGLYLGIIFTDSVLQPMWSFFFFLKFTAGEAYATVIFVIAVLFHI